MRSAAKLTCSLTLTLTTFADVFNFSMSHDHKFNQFKITIFLSQKCVFFWESIKNVGR